MEAADGSEKLHLHSSLSVVMQDIRLLLNIYDQM